MYTVQDLTVNDGDLALGSAKTFDLPIRSRACKICYIKLVQLTAGKMDLTFQIWESTTAQGDPHNQALLYQLILTRRIELDAAEGGQYGESLTRNPLPYDDRDTVDEDKTYRLHCRIVNNPAGLASDFAVVVKIADMGEDV